MKSKKTYGAYGFVEWNVAIPLNGTFLNVPFKGGSFTELGVNPASFQTENPILQIAIENSIQFKDGRIKMIKETPSFEDETSQETDSKTSSVSEVKNMQEAKELLRTQYGVDLKDLQSKADILRKAEELNIVFSNWK